MVHVDYPLVDYSGEDWVHGYWLTFQLQSACDRHVTLMSGSATQSWRYPTALTPSYLVGCSPYNRRFLAAKRRLEGGRVAPNPMRRAPSLGGC